MKLGDKFNRSFIYLTDPISYNDILSKSVLDCLCKHVLNIGGDKSYKVYEEAKELGNAKVRWGSGDSYMEHVKSLVANDYTKPVRIVITGDGLIWIDNLHVTLSYMISNGLGIKLNDLPHYIVDLRGDLPIIASYNNSVHDSVKDIQETLSVAFTRNKYSSDELGKINYTISDFIIENGLSEVLSKA